MTLSDRVLRTIQREGLARRGARVVVALSGGADSVALVQVLRDLDAAGQLVLAGLAHFNHQLRGADADEDERFCRAVAAALGLPIEVGRADVRALALEQRRSVEDAARAARYAFLEHAADALGAERIAVAHTRDDQAETFLLKLMRGAGLRGLAGIYPQRGAVIRPLLDVTHEALREYLRSCAETWVDDETNDDLENPRNRIRHRVLPELDRAAEGSTVAAISRAAALIREDGQWLDALGEERFLTLAHHTKTGLELDVRGLAETPAPVRRRVLLRAMRAAGGTREIGLEHVEAAVEVLMGASRGADIPCSRVELRRGKLVLLRSAGSARADS
jgi:tRNA(Ile)-lysidine synthase